MLKECWNRVDNESVKNCYFSFIRRLKLVMMHKGRNNFSYKTKARKLFGSLTQIFRKKNYCRTNGCFRDNRLPNRLPNPYELIPKIFVDDSFLPYISKQGRKEKQAHFSFLFFLHLMVEHLSFYQIELVVKSYLV
jgi:hypothetical protein